VVTATWGFASGSHHASWLGCHVPVIEADGRPMLNPNGTPVVRTMLFPKSATKFTDIWHTIGLRGTGSDQYSVTDLFVPEDHSVDVLSRRDMQAREEGLLYRFSSLVLYAPGFAGVALGIAGSTSSHFIELARDKIPRGARNTLRNNNVIQRGSRGRGAARLGAALSDRLAGGHHRGGRRARPHHIGRADDDPPRRDLRDPHIAGGRRHPLPGRRRHRDL
jgi:hypothetical protein